MYCDRHGVVTLHKLLVMFSDQSPSPTTTFRPHQPVQISSSTEMITFTYRKIIPHIYSRNTARAIYLVFFGA